MVEVPAQPPLLADGPFIHHEREPTPIEFETEIRVPNINCDLGSALGPRRILA